MRNTIQKEVVLNTVLSSSDHPDVETIYLRCKNKLPSISIATVYRVLTSLAKQGKILKVDCQNGDRYDKTLYPHAHLKCNECGNVLDVCSVDLTEILNNAVNVEKATLNSVNVIFSGVCENCSSKL